jgi:hypothetical protein
MIEFSKVAALVLANANITRVIYGNLYHEEILKFSKDLREQSLADFEDVINIITSERFWSNIKIDYFPNILNLSEDFARIIGINRFSIMSLSIQECEGLELSVFQSMTSSMPNLR